MSRFIDAELFADRLLNAWDTADKEKKSEIVAILSDIVTPILVGTPTADVAPRAEVANKICCEIEEEIVAALESNYRALKEWDDGRCNDYILEMVNRIKGKIDALRGMEAFVEELKNKYAEGQK